MANLTRMADGARRAAQQVLYGAGGQAVFLRMPISAVSGVLSEQLGMPTAGVSDTELWPVVVRALGSGNSTQGARWEMLVGASAIALLAGDETVDTALGVFRTAVGVVVDGELMRIEGVSHRSVGTAVYLYRVELCGAVTATL